MCSLGHHDHPDTVRAPRRHLDNSASEAVRRMPRKTLKQRRADTAAQLRAEIATGEAEELARGHGVHQLELIPSDEAQLPARRVPHSRLPAPETLWYSAARET